MPSPDNSPIPTNDFQLVDERVALRIQRFPSYDNCPNHLGRELDWREAERVTKLIKERFPKRVIVERYALTSCPHESCPFRIVDPTNPDKTRAYCTYLDIVVKSEEKKYGPPKFLRNPKPAE